jgi:hypothetical protein
MVVAEVVYEISENVFPFLHAATYNAVADALDHEVEMTDYKGASHLGMLQELRILRPDFI